MAKAFTRQANRIVGTMQAEEVAVVLELLGLTRDFVAPEHEATGDPFLDLIAGLGEEHPDPDEPRDPALRRLLPPAHLTDEAQAVEFRRLTEHTVRSRKAANLATAIEALSAAELPTVSLDVDQARALAMALTDIRLILGERLGMRTDEDSERLHESLAAAMQGDEEVEPAVLQQMAYYDFLTWLQDSVTTALMRIR